MTEPPFAQLPGVCVHESNLLEARMIVTTYNQHVRLLSSEPFGWFAPPKFTRAWEPTLLWNHFTLTVTAASVRVNECKSPDFINNRGTDEFTCFRSTLRAGGRPGYENCGSFRFRVEF